ncbi:hypothetical protein LCGC14_0861830 [marine sediment metagenome]|uniref:Uncharacterized protein n=1 Tax=marine sediment metagenome TaxID=412755 RepID=A0A0F9PSM7_9ZZZZ
MKNGILWIICLLLIGGYFGGLIYFWTDYIENKDVITSRVYSGRIYFEVEEEYSQFKKYLATHPEVRIQKLDVLSSSDPLVDMRIEAPAETIFPYGKVVKEYKEGDLYHPVLYTVIAGVVTALLFLIFIPPKGNQ